MSDDLKEFKEQDALAELKAAHSRVLRQLAKRDSDREELVAAVYQAAKDSAASMDIEPVFPPKSDKRKAQGETAILILSDWQIGKITPTYNTDIAAERIKMLSDKVRRLVEIQRTSHPVRELRIYLLGDLVEGEDIFPGQAHLIDAGLYQQMFRGAEVLANLVRNMLGEFEKVKVVGVIGNHGRLGRRGTFRPESNADAMMYRIAKMAVGDDKRLEWPETFTAGERHWYATDKVYDKTWFLFHGDQVSGGFAGFPWYGFGKKLQGWNMSVERFDYSVSGHFHTPVRMYLNGLTHWGGGSIESTNTYAQETLAAAGEPCQYLLFQHPEGVTAEYLIRLK
jgi:hypothetical protein